MPDETVVVDGIYTVRGVYHTETNCPIVSGMDTPDERPLETVADDPDWDVCGWCAGDVGAQLSERNTGQSRYSDAYQALRDAEVSPHD